MKVRTVSRPRFKAIVTSVIAVAFLSLCADDASAFDRVDRRQGRQAARIRDGRLSGEISAKEQHRLNQSRRVVRRAERRTEADGVVTKKEAAEIEGLQDARSRQIRRLKTN